MRRRGGGNIVVIASEWGVIGWPEASAYSASKAGLIALVKIARSRTGAGEHHRQRDRARRHRHPAAPRRRRRRGAHPSTRCTRRYGADIPMGRIGRPEEIASAVALLARNDIWRHGRSDTSNQRRIDTMPGMNDDPRVRPDGQAVSAVRRADDLRAAAAPEDVPDCDVAVVGIPFDSGVTLSARRPVRARRTSGRRRGCCGRTTRRWRCPRSRPSRWSTRATSRPTRSTSPRRCADRGAGERTDPVAARGSSRSAVTTPSPTRCCAPTIVVRSGRAAALRRPPRHVGHLLRRTA